MGAPLPPVIPEPFANAATTGTAPGNKTAPIPDTVTDAQKASWAAGFQGITMQPVTAGGESPLGQDVNGILFAISAHSYYVQAGQLFPYSTAVRDAIGGYALGTILGSTDGATVWMSIVANNMTDPDTNAGAGNWVALSTYGFTTLTGLTGGTVSLSQSQAARGTIVLNGVLTSNLAIVVPGILARWMIVNNTSGGFATTVRASTGTGVNVPQGGFSNPLEVYFDGANVNPTVAPLGVPISQGPDPLTLVERTNGGYVLATYLNQNSPENENLPISQVFTENSGDGYLRKVSLAFFEASMALSAIGGQVSAGQVPLAAVTQYAANILANAALTGVPTAPTAGAGTSTTQVATTAFVNPSSSLATNGFRKNPDGTIDQWGRLHIGDVVGPAAGAIGFNIPFPSQCSSVQVTGFDANATGATYVLQTNGAPSTAGFNWCAREVASATQDVTIMWRAVGF